MTPHFDGVLSDDRWQAISERRPAGFVYGVVTTGIVCRTTCPARPSRRNVRVFDDAAAAIAAGFRACLRCAPLAAPEREEAARVARLCAILDRWVTDEGGSARPRLLAMLAAASGLSRYTVQRLFVRTLGISPQDYLAARRMARMDAALVAAGSSGGTATATVTEAIYGAGFGASSRFYETGSARLGMTASARRKGGEGMDIHVQYVTTTLGRTLVAATDRGICALLFGEADGDAALLADLQKRFPKGRISTSETAFVAPWILAAVASVEEGEVAQEIPLDLRGTVFQERVWQALRKIPRGTTVTYSELAAFLAPPGPTAAGLPTRAVATACGANPIAVLVPFHRVVGKRGTGLRGYRWGLARKAQLLARETNGFSDPAETNGFSDPACRRAETIAIPRSGDCATIAGDEELGGAHEDAPPRRRG